MSSESGWSRNSIDSFVLARLESEGLAPAPEAARERLVALGYADPAAALRHLEALASGVTRKAAIQRTLLPVLLGWFADSADPIIDEPRFKLEWSAVTPAEQR